MTGVLADRVAIVAGIRTPFARAGTALKSLSAIELGRLCVAELVQRTGIAGNEIDLLTFGTVVYKPAPLKFGKSSEFEELRTKRPFPA